METEIQKKVVSLFIERLFQVVVVMSEVVILVVIIISL